MKPDWKKALDNAKPSFKARNPHLYKPVAELRAQKSERHIRGKGEDRGVETSEGCIRYRIVFTTYRKRLLDEGDNANSALKAIRDRVVQWLVLPDDSSRWVDCHYHQIKSDVVNGTHILIKRL